jgi:hypothetical protein
VKLLRDEISRKGEALRLPFLKIKIWPVCCTMNSRFEPSPAFVTKTGFVRPLTTVVKSSVGGVVVVGAARTGLAEIAPMARVQITITLRILKDFIMGFVLFILENIMSENLSIPN